MKGLSAIVNTVSLKEGNQNTHTHPALYEHEATQASKVVDMPEDLATTTGNLNTIYITHTSLSHSGTTLATGMLVASARLRAAALRVSGPLCSSAP